jgi:hypothetical protein
VHFVEHLISLLTGTKKTTKIDVPQNRMNAQLVYIFNIYLVLISIQDSQIHENK